MKIKTILNDYLEYAQFYLVKETVRGYVRDFKLISRALSSLSIINASDIKVDTIDKLNRWLKKNTQKKNSKINDTVSTFIAALNHAKIDLSGVRLLRLKDDTVGYRPIPENELIELIDYLKSLDLKHTNNKSWALCVFLMLDTGVRLDELLNIKTKNIDLHNQNILLEKTKTSKKRIVPFGDLSYDILMKNYKASREYLVWNYYANIRMSKNSFFKFLSRTSDHLQLTSGAITSHRFRKTFATRLLRMGCPITTIQKLLGHTDIRTTMIYLEIDDVMLQNDYLEYYSYHKIKKVEI